MFIILMQVERFLDKFQTSFPDDRKELPECAICFENLIEKTSTLECGHVFHEECWNRWKSINDSCPMCRTNQVPNSHFIQHGVTMSFGIIGSHSALIKDVKVSIYWTREEILLSLLSKAPFLEKLLKENQVRIRGMVIRGCLQFAEGRTLAEYEILPGTEMHCNIFLNNIG